MKKIVLICLAALMILSLGNVVFAADDFVSSPSNTGAPELISAKNVSQDCVAVVSVTSYSDKDTLPDEVADVFKQAYDIILGRTENADYTALLDQIAEEKNIERKDLIVSDFFDISCSGCEDHDNHGSFDIVLKTTALDKFVCLLHFENGSWHVVDNAEITQNNTHLEFQEDGFSPFAIIVDVGENEDDYEREKDSPWIAILITSAIVASGAAGYGIYRYVSMKRNKI